MKDFRILLLFEYKPVAVYSTIIHPRELVTPKLLPKSMILSEGFHHCLLSGWLRKQNNLQVHFAFQ